MPNSRYIFTMAPKLSEIEAVFYDMTPRLILPPALKRPPRPTMPDPGPLPTIASPSLDLASRGRYEYRGLDKSLETDERTVRPRKPTPCEG